MHEVVTLIAKYLIVVPALTWLFVLWRLPPAQRYRFVAFSVIAGLLTLLFMKIGASLHQDPRPFVRDHVSPYFSHGPDNGFPSDHTALSSLIALVVLRYRLKLGVGLVVVAILIGAARVIAGIHHGQDIVGGMAFAALGMFITLGIETLYKRYRRSTD